MEERRMGWGSIGWERNKGYKRRKSLSVSHWSSSTHQQEEKKDTLPSVFQIILVFIIFMSLFLNIFCPLSLDTILLLVLQPFPDLYSIYFEQHIGCVTYPRITLSYSNSNVNISIHIFKKPRGFVSPYRTTGIIYPSHDVMDFRIILGAALF